jgi:hypothetical protein|tara:strand:- start:7066 stop:7398 length:333 start_codon:yes stop_codon:yes gene_type:complete
MIKELKWNVDGHRLLLNINKTELVVTHSICPHGNSVGSACYHAGIESCAVNYFINVYGLETNTGVVGASESVEVAWALSGSTWDIDLVDFSMIPVADPHFSDWLAEQASE